MNHNDSAQSSILPPPSFASDIPDAPFAVPAELAAWIARVSRGERRAELALWATLVCVNFANFSSLRAFHVFVAEGEAMGLLAYEHDEAQGFQARAVAVGTTINAALRGRAMPAENVQVGLCVGCSEPPDAMSTLPLVLCIGPKGGDDRLFVSLGGTRAEALHGWTAWYWAGLVHLASATAAEPTRPLRALDLLPQDQRALFEAMNRTGHDYRPTDGLVERFLAHAQGRPGDLAICGVARDFSWAELRDYAARLAMWLEDEYQVRGRVVAVIADRHELCVPTFLAIAMAGATYLPLSPEYPVERLSFILDDARAVLTLSIGQVPDGLRAACVDVESLRLPSQPRPPALKRDPDDLLYIIYTSGSTGQPKGVCVRDRNVLRLVDTTSYVDWQASDRIAFAAAPAFDAATFEIWGALAQGLSLVVVPQEVFLDPLRLRNRLAATRVTLAFVSTALFNYHASRDPNTFSPLRVLLTGGDTCAPALLCRVMEANPALHVHHVYGPTENTTFSTWHPLALPLGERLPIGRPISNSTAWVVDANLRPLPIGARGELLVGGAGIASGYLNRPELTAARFVTVEDALGDDACCTAYLTGDLARWLPNGTIDFLGRRDYQVKVRGYRVELDEVRAALLSIPGVGQAEVLPTEPVEGGYQSLEAYLCCEGPLDLTQVREHLTAHLPPYMVPARIVPLLQFPITPNGKIDRASLVRSAAEHSYHGGDKAGPRHEVDRSIIGCWRELLHVDEIGIHDQWAALGGHSMLLLELAKRLHQVLGVEFLLRELVSLTTVAALSDAVLAHRAGSGAPTPTPTQSGSAAGERLPVLPTQRQIFLYQQRSPASAAFHIPLLMRLDGNLDVERLADAWSATLDAHAALQMSFHSEGDEVVQRRHDRSEAPLSVRYIASDTLDGAIAEEVARPFDLTRPTPVRLVLFRSEHASQHLLLVCHHVAVDGVSLQCLVSEVASRYRAESPPSDALDYVQALQWSYEQARGSAEDVARLAASLEGSVGAVRLSLAPAVRGDSNRAAMARRAIDPALQQSVSATCRARGFTPTVMMMGALYLLLWQYGGEPDLCLGSPVSGRGRHAHSRTIGMFAGTIVLRQRFEPDTPLSAFLHAVDATLRDALAHECADYEAVAHAMGRASERLFNVLFSMQTLGEMSPDFGSGVTASYMPVDVPAAKYDLALRVQETGPALALGLEYRCSLMNAAEASRFLERYVELLARMTESPDAALCQLEGLTQREQQCLAKLLAPQSMPVREDLPSILARHMREHPEREVLADSSSRLNWAELARRSEALAARLVAAGVHRGDVVGLYMRRTVDTVVAMLGCWRIGAAYLSLDIDWDTSRIARQAGLASIKAIVVDNAENPRPPTDAELIAMAELDTGSETTLPAFLPPAADDIAYVIFTSGSTGLPKGVPITHGNLAHYAHGLRAFCALGAEVRGAVLSSLSFDLAYTSVWPVLLAGGSVHIAPPISQTGPQAIADFIAEHRVTLVKVTPSLLNLLVEPWIDRPPTSMRILVTGGEFPRVHDLRRIAEALPNLRMVNHYGPTEATVGCIATVVDQAMLERAVLPIGRPIDGMRALVLDAQGRPLPPGLVGELCVAGAGVSPGYLHADPAQRSRFRPAPATINAPMYRTGDLAYWDDEDRIVLAGRADRQVKIRGYRIELAELECSAEALPGVRRAAALAVRNPVEDLELALFVATDASLDDVQAGLTAAVPAFLQPTYVYCVDEIPLNSNGKVDVQVLARLHAERGATPHTPSTEPFDEPASVRLLRELWERQTGLEAVSADAPLISVGGSSLQILRFFGELRRTHGDFATLPEVFASTLRSLAVRLDARSASAMPVCAEFLVNARPVTRFANTQRVGLPCVLTALIAQAVYEDHDGDAVTLRVRHQGSDRTIALDFCRYDDSRALFNDIEAQWTSTRAPDSTADLRWVVAIDDEAPIAGVDSSLAVQITQNGLHCRAYAAQPAIASQMAALAERVHRLLNDFQ
ncbi:amino acid adenylation domain-containing protein [Paraburkholderia sp. A1RI_3L]|uniref:amino acid adenylation domain-containing protein n=1 Tax=Paraburkholderia TaxID=1822464 RepID=UPI003B789501